METLCGSAGPQTALEQEPVALPTDHTLLTNRD
jgi:hypothetical protein